MNTGLALGGGLLGGLLLGGISLTNVDHNTYFYIRSNSKFIFIVILKFSLFSSVENLFVIKK